MTWRRETSSRKPRTCTPTWMSVPPRAAAPSTWMNTERKSPSSPPEVQHSPDRVYSLIRYIDTYRDPNAEVEIEEETVEKKKPWWKGGGAAAGKKFSDFVTPTDWLNTELRDGLNTMEVERRRKTAGWNELTTEKENMILKFIGFFRGPILYVSAAVYPAQHAFANPTTRSWKPQQSWLLVFRTGSMPVSLLVS